MTAANEGTTRIVAVDDEATEVTITARPDLGEAAQVSNGVFAVDVIASTDRWSVSGWRLVAERRLMDADEIAAAECGVWFSDFDSAVQAIGEAFYRLSGGRF